MSASDALASSRDTVAGLTSGLSLRRPWIPELRWALIELCVNATRVLALPRSVGEIFGFVFSADAPVTFEEVASGLCISNGSASHGLRYLRRIGAIKPTYVARDRRDFWEPEISLRKLVNGFLGESALFQLGEARERLKRLVTEMEARPPNYAGTMSERVRLLIDWDRQLGTAISVAVENLR